MSTSGERSQRYKAVPQADDDEISATESYGQDLDAAHDQVPADATLVRGLPSISIPSINRFRVIAGCMTLWAVGANDQAPGALIPYIEKYYNISYAVVSLLFVGSATGLLCSAFIIEPLRRALGTPNTFMITNGVLACSQMIMILAPPWPFVVAACFVMGVCESTQIALANVFVSNLENGTALMGIMHGFYCIGGMMGPFFATSLATQQVRWSWFYVIPLSMALINMSLTKWSFQHYDEEQEALQSNVAVTMPASKTEKASIGKMARRCSSTFSSKVVVLGSLFMISYMGIEVVNSGWAISYMIDYRHGSPSVVGYVTVGYWTGATLGRFIVPPFAKRFGESRLIYWSMASLIGSQMLLWTIPSIIVEAGILIVLGFLLGPIYPIAVAVFVRTMPPEDQLAGVGALSAMGAFGASAGPFLVGLTAQYTGLWVLNPINIGFSILMILCWLLV